LSARALRAADGQVRCGRCGEVFNALTSIAEDTTEFAEGDSPLDLEARADELLRSPPEAVEEIAAPPGMEIAQLQILDPLVDDSEFELEPVLAEALPAVPVEAVSVPAATAPPAPVQGLEVSEDVRREMLASYAHAELPQINESRRRLPLGAWVAAAILLAILLAVQIIAGNREWLIAHAGLLGQEATPAPSLSAYQLRQWGVTGDPAAKGTLRVRASVMNTAAQAQPYPLLRVILADRFGTRVGAREFEPAEYLGRAPGRMLAPGERLDATLDIVDPGKDAEGFEIDVCVRGGGQKIICAGDGLGQTE